MLQVFPVQIGTRCLVLDDIVLHESVCCLPLQQYDYVRIILQGKWKLVPRPELHEKCGRKIEPERLDFVEVRCVVIVRWCRNDRERLVIEWNEALSVLEMPFHPAIVKRPAISGGQNKFRLVIRLEVDHPSNFYCEQYARVTGSEA